MKRLSLVVFCLLVFTLSKAQWITSGSNIYNSNSGSVGIGTNSPISTLHLVSNLNTSGANSATIGAPNLGPYQSHIHYGSTGDWYIRSARSTGNVLLQDTGGKVGVGTASPTETLDVNGNARIRGVLKVDNLLTLLGNYQNIFLGSYSGTNTTTGSYNTLMGFNSGFYNTTGYHNVFLGMESGYWNTTGTGNTFLGNYAGGINATGSHNTAVGNSAGNTNGSNNVSIGVEAGARTGYANNFSGSVFVGRAAGPINANTYTNVVAIGENAVVGTNNAFVLGNSLHNIGIRQNSPTYPLHVQNAYCDGNTWFNASDKNLKENFARIQTEESVLAKVMALTIQYWNYKGTAKARHIGPTAQDFHKTFQLGDNEHAIASVDEAGVALAAIQELAKKTEKLEHLLLAQQQLIASLLTSRGEDSGTFEKYRKGLELQQNNPNPFSQETEIRMSIPEGIIEATLYIYDLQGKPVKSQLVTQRGSTSVRFQAGSLSAGMYLYTLVADGQATSSKRMILTE